ncbi:hypothetical protein BG015_008262 [Linnemannia schmuckeri]|uniref:DUF7587 domain-containing protein n=1 Tax=Linnemannia schmuckeri TaxID=64567 RepID=A0A9P5RZB7_9FUNG|nr:hypothetical protein BG015_008262 [Linnemannia schmuckeri]
MAVQNLVNSDIDYLYRLLRQQDSPSEGLLPTDPYANISIKEHICRRGASVVSPYISTSRDPVIMLRWLFQEGQKGHNGAIAIISCRRLDFYTTLHDLSRGNYDFSDDYFNKLVLKYGEVLVHPRIDKNAIIGLKDAIERYYLIRCSHCMEPGHDSSDSQKLDDWLATENTIERFYSIR